MILKTKNTIHNVKKSFFLIILILFKTPGVSFSQLPDPSSDKKIKAIIFEQKILCKQPERYIGWPTITRTKSGELLVVFSGSRDAHICPFGITQMIRSTDNGKTWSAPETINNTPLDDRDAGILETKNGTLLVSWFTSLAFDKPELYKANPSWVRHAEKISPETKKLWLGNWTRRSTDQGKTWQEPVKQIVSAPHGPIELSDGRLLYMGTATLEGNHIIGVEESTDDGKTWKFISKVNLPEGKNPNHFWEPHLVENQDGTITALIRYNPPEKSENYLHQTVSADGGKTWSTAVQTPVWGYPAHIIRLKNNWLLAVYGVRRPVYSERACLSKDGGKTWDLENEMILSEAPNSDLGYPASVQLSDGSIYTVYYQAEKAGEKTCLMATHWMIKN